MKRNLVVIFVLLIFIVSCDLTNDINKKKVSVEFNKIKLNTEKLLWDSSKPNNYQYIITNAAFEAEYLPINALVIIEDGQYKNQEPNTQYGTVPEDYRTIDKIYKTIENNFKKFNNSEQSKNDYYLKKIIVEYDEENHIPIKIEYFYHLPENLMDTGSYWKYEIIDYIINE